MHKLAHHLIALLFLLLLIFSPAVVRADVWQQTDWSGGIGSSTSDASASLSNILTTTAGQVSLIPTNDWTYSGWSHRQSILITNSAAEQNHYPVKLTIPFLAHMQTDFNDLRFAQGSSELSYWIEEATAEGEATVWVKVDTLSGFADTEIHLYFGNATATSESSGADVFEFFDDFSAESVDTNVWRVNNYSTSMANIVDGELVLTSTASNWNYGMTSLQTFSRADLVIEMDYRWESGNSSYDAMMLGWKDNTNNTHYSNLVYAYYNSGTGTCVSNCAVNVYEDANNRSISSGSVWTQNAETKLRIFMNETNGAVYQQSFDNGENWTTSYTSTYSSESNLRVGFSIHTGQHAFDNVRVRPFLATEPTSTIGSTESYFPDSGELMSNIFDTGEWGAIFSSVSYSTDHPENVFVKVRSGNTTDLSDAIDFAHCPTVTSGEELASNSCVQASDRYVQYVIELLSAGNTSPIFNDISIQYDSLYTEAEAGTSKVIVSGKSLTLDGTQSVGQNLNYSWNIFSGSGELTDRQTANPTFTSTSATTSQNTIITLSVFDDYGHRSSDTVTLSIVATPSLQYSDESFSAAKDGLLFSTTNTTTGQLQLTETTSGLTLLLPEGLATYTYAVSETGVFAVGLPEADEGSGRVYVFQNNITDLLDSFDLSQTDTSDYTILTGRTAGDAFGTELLFTDLENDGHEDLVITAPFAGEFGQVSFYDDSFTLYGILEGDSNTAMGKVLASTLDESESMNLVFGPFNPSGETHFVFSDGNEIVPSHDVLVFADETDFSGSLVPSYLAPDMLFSGANAFKTLAIGDLNQDSINDVVLADTEQTVYIFFGPFDSSTYSDTDADVIIVADAAETRFGEALQIDDVNGDAQNDLIIGSPEAGTRQEGAIYIAFGNSTWESEIDATSSVSMFKVLGEMADGQVGSTLLLTDSDDNGAKEIYSLTSANDLFFIDVTQAISSANWPESEDATADDTEDETTPGTDDTTDYDEPDTNSQATNNNGDSTQNPAEAGAASGCSLVETNMQNHHATTLILFCGFFSLLIVLRRCSIRHTGNF